MLMGMGCRDTLPAANQTAPNFTRTLALSETIQAMQVPEGGEVFGSQL
jgi:hypothetical protein